MITRRSVWSDEAVQEKLRAFVPAADEVGHLQRSKGADGELFRRVAEEGHYAGRVYPTGTRQGIYALTADGRFLASVNTRRAADVLAMLERALVALEEQDAASADEAGDDAADAEPSWRFRSHYPEDGLALVVYSRDLPRPDPPDDWRAGASNLDHAWFRRDEVRSMIPDGTVGAERVWPGELSHRLARLHLVDNVRGQVLSFARDDVERASFTSRVTAVDGDVITLEIAGDVRMVARGEWPVNGHRDRDEPRERERGVEGAAFGHAEFDRASGRFVRFDLVVDAERWGGTQYNGRHDDLGRSGVGYVLVPADPDDRVEPAIFWEYRWR